RIRFVHQIDVMKAIIRSADLREEFEGRIHLGAGARVRIRGSVPRKILRARSEWIVAGTTKRVPVGDAEPEELLHRLSADLLVWIVPFESERVVALSAFERDFPDTGKVFLISCNDAHDTLCVLVPIMKVCAQEPLSSDCRLRSEEHTSELQSREN